MEPPLKKPMHPRSYFMKQNDLLKYKELPVGGWMYSRFGLPPKKISKAESIYKKTNGVFVFKKNNTIEIITDVFGTTPVFFDEINETISNDLRQINSNDNLSTKIDFPGFWESVIYDYSFLSRTLNKGIIQVPGGSIFHFDYCSRKWSITRWNYFDISNFVGVSRDLLDLIDKRLTKICSNIWEKLPVGGKILLPLSGGLDSRLLALYLILTGDPKRIKAVTFGFSKKSYEYKIAKQVCENLQITDHTFHALPRDIYPEITQDYWQLWRGCLSVTHAHLFSYLKNNSNENNIIVTGFMADPIAGYAASQRQSPDVPLESCNVFKKLIFHANELRIDQSINDTIIADLITIYNEWKNNCHYIGFDEYIYLTQRQPKTFSLLLYSYKNYCEVSAPFSDPALVSLFMSAPFDLRKDKKIIRMLLNLRKPTLANIEDVSSAISKDYNITNISSASRRKRSSRFAVLLSVITNDSIKYFSPYWTEDLYNAFRCECRNDILATLRYFFENNIITDEQFILLSKKPLRSFEVSRCGKILSFLPASINSFSA
jgi:asparagine synthetase B (glutamine-hydrolysing)